jgi:hypothetical protein
MCGGGSYREDVGVEGGVAGRRMFHAAMSLGEPRRSYAELPPI